MYYCWKAGGGGGTTGGEFWKDDIKYASAAAAGMDGGDITPTGVSATSSTGTLYGTMWSGVDDSNSSISWSGVDDSNGSISWTEVNKAA